MLKRGDPTNPYPLQREVEATTRLSGQQRVAQQRASERRGVVVVRHQMAGDLREQGASPSVSSITEFWERRNGKPKFLGERDSQIYWLKWNDGRNGMC